MEVNIILHTVLENFAFKITDWRATWKGLQHWCGIKNEKIYNTESDAFSRLMLISRFYEVCALQAHGDSFYILSHKILT